MFTAELELKEPSHGSTMMAVGNQQKEKVTKVDLLLMTHNPRTVNYCLKCTSLVLATNSKFKETKLYQAPSKHYSCVKCHAMKA